VAEIAACVVVFAVSFCSLACEAGVRPPPAAAAPMQPASEAPAPRRIVRLRGDAPGAVETLRKELEVVGFSVVDGNEVHDADLLLTVTSAASAGGSPMRRTTLTLSATVGEHEMEDISAHFARAEGEVDALTVRDLCRRWKRRYLRLQSATTDIDR